MTKKRPEKKAVALFYDGKTAPSVSAAGAGALAEQIIEIAREHGVPLFENEMLLRLLMDLGVGEEIPETLYLCIAQVIAFAYKIQGKFPENWQANDDGDDREAHSLPALNSLTGDPVGFQ